MSQQRGQLGFALLRVSDVQQKNLLNCSTVISLDWYLSSLFLSKYNNKPPKDFSNHIMYKAVSLFGNFLLGSYNKSLLPERSRYSLEAFENILKQTSIIPLYILPCSPIACPTCFPVCL